MEVLYPRCCGLDVHKSSKLAVLLHHLWVSAEVYEPLHNSKRTAIAAAA
jgi:hypothetical protein